MKKILIFKALLLLSLPVFAQYEMIYDSTFSGDGSFKSGVTIKDQRGTYLQEDGKLIVYGDTDLSDGSETFTIIRLLPNGTLDPTFNQTGVASWDQLYHGYFDSNVFTLDNGNLVIASNIYEQTPSGSLRAYPRFTVIRPNGTPEPLFGQDGRLTLSADTNTYAFYAVHAGKTADNKILVACYAASEITPDSFVNNIEFYRILPNGVIDNTFGINGRQIVPLNDVNFTRIFQDPSNPDIKYILFESTYVNSNESGIIRINPDYTSETLFEWQSEYTMWQAEMLPGPRWFLGKYNYPYYDIPAVVNSDGTLDKSFSRDGLFEVYGGFPAMYYRSIIPAPSGKFYVDLDYFSIGRLNANGSIDYSFDFDGIFKPSDPDELSWELYPRNIIELPDGKVVISGRAKDKFYVVRLKAKD